MDFPKALGKLNKLFVIVFLQFGAVWKIPDWFSARLCSFNPNKVQALKKCSDEPLIKLTLQSIFPGQARLGWLLVLEFVKCSRLLSLWIILSEARDGPGLHSCLGICQCLIPELWKRKPRKLRKVHREFSNLKTQCMALLLCTVSVVELQRKMLVRKWTYPLGNNGRNTQYGETVKFRAWMAFAH